MISHEDREAYYGTLDNPGEMEGLECPYCGILFIVLATDGSDHPIKPIIPTGAVDHFCPCCGNNLKEDIERLRIEAAKRNRG